MTTQTTGGQAGPVTDGSEGVPDAGFIAPVPAEADLPALFPGDTGSLEADVRQVLVRLLRQRYLSAAAHPGPWKTLLAHQATVESRLHDLFVHLVVDHERGLAYKRQVRKAEVEVPVLLKDEPYSRVETVLLVHLRALFQREQGAGEQQARVDAEELEQTVLSYLPAGETNLAARQKEIAAAVARLVRERVLAEESQGRYRVLPVVEVILSADRLAELVTWLRDGDTATPGAEEPGSGDAGGSAAGEDAADSAGAADVDADEEDDL
ncbi:hypothetical protein DNL40_05755 [Xylanimonas oleitrophica]|uniref:DUF4194 domain-containing protein n=1 Tax=Xylanimonas oleitrophica TaxID=2607479 RepID=A0A2W5WR97_9MICO|nr:DUF4194 domain-containing protein [Xylanimonas oleitrophica]PZR53640.1 hypothetical protein DNL40_05755 [Xylanimonas oleitrophica]